MKKELDRRTIGYLLALSALLISIPRYIAVFERIDRLPLTAYGMGILLALGAAYILDAYTDAQKRDLKRSTWPLLIAFVINLVYEAFIVVPFVLSRLWQVDLAAVMAQWYAILWSIVVASAPVVLVGGVVLAVSYRKDSTRPKQRTQGDAIMSEYKAIVAEYKGAETQKPTFNTKREHIIWLHERNPEFSQAQLAQEVGCSASTVTRALNTNTQGGEHD